MYAPHVQAITKIVWDEQKQILCTASKDKAIKFWQVPDNWNLYTPFVEAAKEPALVPPVPSVPKSDAAGSDEDEDNDDLKGWSRK